MIHPDEKPIFIIGGGRSGTTLARYILNAHPNIYIAEEISFLSWMDHFRGDLRAGLERYFKTFSYIWLRQNPQKILDALPKELTRDDITRVYLEILKAKARQYQRTRIGEKNPIFTNMLDKVFKNFPNAKIINVIRDPRANVFSHTTMPWASGSLLVSSFLLRLNYGLVKKHGDKILNIKLEDLIASPREAIGTILNFIEEPWSDQVLDHAKYTLHNEGIPFPWLNEASRERKTKTLKWTDGMSPAWIRIVERMNREQMQRFGYKPHPMANEPGFTEFIAAILRDIPEIFYSLYQSLRMTYKLITTPLEKAWELQEVMHGMNPRAWKNHPEWSHKLPQLPTHEFYKEVEPD